VWIISAGYGLISPSNRIAPYGATFAPKQRDSIANGSIQPDELNAMWWRLLCHWRPPLLPTGAPRSITEIASRDPRATNLFVLPPDYFRALREDLAGALACTDSPENFIILSSEQIPPKVLERNIIRTDARLQTYLGGARASLGIRIARILLDKLRPNSINLESSRKLVLTLLQKHGVSGSFDRHRLTDAEVVKFIEAELLTGPTTSYSSSLRKLRDSGRACEMRRFRDLFKKTKQKLYG
jgi:hypothetical protein